MANVHPTAVIDEQAELADDVHVGPGCIIDGPVRIGAGTHLLAQVYLQGPLTLGDANILYPQTCLGFAPQHRAFDPDTPGAGLTIGDRNVFREGATAHRAFQSLPTTIGDDNYLMVGAHVGHDSVVGNVCTFGNCAALGGHVHVQDRVTLGGNAAVHQFCRVGRLAMISGVMGISQDMPPFCVCYVSRTVGSLNVVGLRRAGLRDHIKPLQRAFDMLYRHGHTNDQAAASMERELCSDPLCAELARFVRETERGITPYAGDKTLETAKFE